MIVDEKSKPNFRLSTNFDVTEISYVYNGGGVRTPRSVLPSSRPLSLVGWGWRDRETPRDAGWDGNDENDFENGPTEGGINGSNMHALNLSQN